jgi:hypothetical protein
MYAMAEKWSLDDSAKLISKIKNIAVLWCPSHGSYGKRGPRTAALKKVAAEFPGRGMYK